MPSSCLFTTMPAWPLDYKSDDALEIYLSDIYTVLANITGLPAIAIAVKKDSEFIGLQLIGKRGGDASLLRLAKKVAEILQK